MSAVLKKLLVLSRQDLAGGLAVVGGVFVVLHIITALAVKFSGEGSSLLLSGIVLPIVAGVVILYTCVGHICVTFDQALRFGQTRRRALGLVLGVIGALSAAVMGSAALLNCLERAFAPKFWQWLSGAQAVAIGPESGVAYPQGIPREAVLCIEDFFFGWKLFVLIALGAMVLGVVAGAVFHRFGAKGGWFLWGCWMLFFVVFQMLPWKTHTVVDWLIPLLAVIALAMLAWALWWLLHAQMNN